MKNFFKKNSTLAFAAIFVALGLTGPMSAFAAGPPAVSLGGAGNFRILGETGVSDANPTISSIVGNIGVSPAAGSSMTGISCTNVTGNIYDVDGTYTGGYNSNVACLLAGPGANKTIVDTAVGDMGTAYTNASAPATPAGVGANLNVGSGTLNGQNFAPGTWTWGTNVTITGDITLTGTASDIWIFQVTGTLGINANKKIILAGGALPSNIFWQVTGATTLQSGSDFSGNILDQTNIAMQAGATLHGRALAQSAVTLIGNTVTSVAPAPVVVAPTVVTNSASSVTTSAATLNGTITATGGTNATQSGFAYSTDPTLTTSVSTSTIGAQTGTASFVQNLTGLSPSTTYYDRAYATNSAGPGFGSIQSFTTSATPAPAAPVSSGGGGNSQNSGLGSGSNNSGSGVSQTTTITTVTTANPVATSSVPAVTPSLPNTGFPPQENNVPWNIIVMLGMAATLTILCGVLWKKRSA
jgi:hypothetical protein